MSENPYIDRDDVLSQIADRFTARHTDYADQRRTRKKRLGDLEKQLAAKQDARHPMACSEQILLEAGWLLNYSDDWPRADKRLDALERSLADTGQPPLSQGDDGSWGACCEAPYRKLEPTVDALQSPQLQSEPLKPLRFLRDLHLDSPHGMLDYLYRLQTSDIYATGANNRDELGAVQTALSQLIFKDEIRDLLANRPELCFTVSEELEATYSDYLHQTQHPRTGFWGPWYRFGTDLVMVQDLSFTFHVINYRGGDIARWPLVIDTTLAIKDLTYPAGWRPNDGALYNNHNNYDVALVFALGWPHMTAAQKADVRREIRDMLKWCLTQSVERHSDGSLGFKSAEADAVDDYYFGVRFLDRVGVWDPAKRFWSRQTPDLPVNAPSPRELCLGLQRGFAAVDDRSEEADTVRFVLRNAVCLTAPDPLSA